jgi:hypothetical protein
VLSVFVLGSDGVVHEQYQSTQSAWLSSYTQFTNPSGVTMQSDPAVALSSDGGYCMFVLGSTGQVYLQYQTTAGGAWLSVYTQFGNPSGVEMVGDPAVVQNANNRLYMFVLGTNNQINLQYQTAPSNGPWRSAGYTQFSNPTGVTMVNGPAVGRDSAGYMQMFAVGSDGQMYYAYETSSGGSWHVLVPIGGTF